MLTPAKVSADFEYLKELQAEWELPNQQSVVSRLIEHHKNRVDVAKLLQESQRLVAHLEAQVKQLQEKNNQLEQANNN